MSNIVIGLAGKAGAGKDTAAEYLLGVLPGYERYGFADPIKRVCMSLFGWDEAWMNDRILKETDHPYWGFSPRKACQLLGTEFGRALRPDLWIHMAHTALLDTPLVVSDVRFDNEAEWVRKYGILIHIDRPSTPISQIDNPGHSSENGVTRLPGDYILNNTKDIPHMHSELDLILKSAL